MAQDKDAMKKVAGTVISVDNAVENLQFIRKSKELAKTHDWLYHCTTVSALKSILKNREFWLSNLKCVNDDEEAERIDIPEYENKHYICCFTYDSQIPDAHWEEYGNESDGVLIGIKTDWFLREAIHMSGDNSKCNDELIKNISGMGYIGNNGARGRTLTPEIAGIIKSTHGICKRPGKESRDKDWTTEKEVRLKVGIQQLETFSKLP